MYFDEGQHIYTHKVTGEIYPSVTTILKKYKNDFQEKSIPISENFVKNHPEIQTKAGAQELIDKYCVDVTVEEFLSEPVTPKRIRHLWKQASIAGQRKGNNYHFAREMEINSAFNPDLPDDYNDKIMTLKDLSELPDGVYPELRLWSEKYKIAGTADIVIIERPYIDILDHKTNKREIYPYSKYADNMKYPFDYLQDIAYNHYGIQLNIYAFLLQELGFKPRKIEIQHKRFLDNETIPDYYKLAWKSDEELKKLRKIPIRYYPFRMESFLQYDYANRQ